jgi:hypothetical protein
MVITSDSAEFNFIFGLTIFNVSIELITFIYLTTISIRNNNSKLFDKKDPQVVYPKILSIFTGTDAFSRIFYMIFDYKLTKFDLSLYYINPNVWFWKIGLLISVMGIIACLYLIEKYFLSMKYRGVSVILMVIGNLFVFFYPISSMKDFEFVSLLSIVVLIPCGILIYEYLKFAIKSRGKVRRDTMLFITALITITISGVVVNAGVIEMLNSALQVSVDIFMYFLQGILKAIMVSIFVHMIRGSTVEPEKWLQNVWVIEKTSGVCIFEANFTKIQINADLISGFMTAITCFGTELAHSQMKGILYKDLNMYFVNSEKIIIAMTTKKDVNEDEVDLFAENVQDEFLNKYRDELTNWKGEVEIFNKFSPYMERIMKKKPIFQMLESKKITTLTSEQIESLNTNIE